MKTEIHPQYFQTPVTCGCGTQFTVGSTKKELNIEICSKCHPFYTGEKNILDSTGRVERFKQMQERKDAIASSKKESKTKKEKKSDEKKSASLKDLKKK